MTGTSNKPSSFQRADGWCESAGMTCESILERNAERVKLVGISGENRYMSRVEDARLQLGWQRGNTLVPFFWDGSFLFHKSKRRNDDVRLKISTCQF